MSTFLMMVLLVLAGQDQTDQEIQKLIEQLGSSRLVERDRATKELIDKGEEALPEARKAMQSRNPEVRYRARRIVIAIEFGGRAPNDLLEQVPWLGEYLLDGRGYDAYLRFQDEGTGLTRTEWGFVIVETLRSADRIDRERLHALLKHALNGGHADAVATNLGQHAGTDDQRRRISVRLIELLGANDSRVRWLTLYILGELRASACVPHIVPLLQDSDIRVRVGAANALGKLGATQYAPQIAELLKDAAPPVRWAAIYSLGELRAKEHAAAIAGFLNDPELRASVINALGKIGAREYRDKIEKFIDDPDEKVKTLARETLTKLAEQK